MPEPPRPQTRMNPWIKGCLIAFAVIAGLILLAVGACFGFLIVKGY